MKDKHSNGRPDRMKRDALRVMSFVVKSREDNDRFQREPPKKWTKKWIRIKKKKKEARRLARQIEHLSESKWTGAILESTKHDTVGKKASRQQSGVHDKRDSEVTALIEKDTFEFTPREETIEEKEEVVRAGRSDSGRKRRKDRHGVRIKQRKERKTLRNDDANSTVELEVLETSRSVDTGIAPEGTLMNYSQDESTERSSRCISDHQSCNERHIASRDSYEGQLYSGTNKLSEVSTRHDPGGESDMGHFNSVGNNVIIRKKKKKKKKASSIDQQVVKDIVCMAALVCFPVTRNTQTS